MLKVVCGVLVLHAVALATELPAPAEERFHQDVAWSPDGHWLAFSEFSGGEYKPEKWSVWVTRVDGSERRRIAEHAMYVSWSPDGRRVAYGAERGEGWGLFSTSLDSGITECFTDLQHKDRQPAWSPDGKHLAFVSDRSGASHIFVLTFGTGDPVQITGDTLKDYNPQWSADGTRLVFYRGKPEGHDDVYIVAPDGTGLRAVTLDSALDIFPCFDTQGGVVFASRATEEAPSLLVRINSDGTRETLTKAPAFFARVSPDGRRIAFISGQWPKSAVYLLDTQDSTITKVIN